MENKALYILASYDDATEKHLAGIQNKLYENGFSGWQTRDLPMHITMASFPTDREEALIEKVKKVAAETSAFEITFNHAGVFQGSNTLFIGPDANADLIALRKAFDEDIDWTAHTTMLIDEPETIYKALPFVMKELSSFRGKVTTLHLYEFFPARHILSVDLA